MLPSKVIYYFPEGPQTKYSFDFIPFFSHFLGVSTAEHVVATPLTVLICSLYPLLFCVNALFVYTVKIKVIYILMTVIVSRI